MIPYGRQWIDEDDIKAVAEVLRSDWLTQGPKIKEFEEALAKYCGAKYAVAVNSGTSALHIACIAAGIGEGDEVITSPITFVASANCILYCGGRPVFADIERETYNIDPAEIKKKITAKTKALIPVHFAGLPCEMEAIKEIADEYNLMIIEDACHALGAEWQDSDGKWHKVGSCSHSDMAVFSFHPVKHITTGEGGAVLTNNRDYYERMLLLRNHGITKNPEKFTNKDLAFSLNTESLISNPNPWYYEMQELGFNYRITDIQCALGLSQLKKIDSFISRRHEIVNIYNEAFKGISGIKTLVGNRKLKSSWHLYALQIDFEKLGKSRFLVMSELKDKGVGTQVHYIPVHLQPYYRNSFGYKRGDYPVAEEYYNKALSLPLYPATKDKDIAKVINSVKECANVR
jgi:UDP-4-amino-4,6-dideoxy-N-acetyl-beta-L-altrosamine transaminase